MKAREKIWKLIKTKILGAKVRYRLFLSKTPVLFRKSVIKYPMGVSLPAAKRRMRNMRQMEFKMERQGLLEGRPGSQRDRKRTAYLLLLYDYPGSGHEQELSGV